MNGMHGHCAMPVIHIIGLGFGGSSTAYHLVRAGYGTRCRIHVWDGDVVEEKNCRNQRYLPDHTGLKKANAIAAQMRAWAGVDAVEHPVHFTGQEPLSGIVFLCVDTMSERKRIVDASIRDRPLVEILIEARADASHILLHVVNPNDPAHMKQWDRYWYPDDEATNVGGCGGEPYVGPEVADLGAYLAVAQLNRYVALRGATRHNGGWFGRQIRIALETRDWPPA